MKILNKLSLFLCTLGLFGAAGAGLIIKQKEAARADAIFDTGAITVDTTINWSSAACNIAIYFYDSGELSNTAWSDYVHASNGQTLVTVTFNSLYFVPDRMIAVRYNPDFEEGFWRQDRWGTDPSSYGWDDSPKWNQTNEIHIDVDGGSHIRITDANWAEADDYAAIVTNSYSLDLICLKTNDYGHCEYYFDTELFETEKFKVRFAGVDYNSFTTLPSISGNFSIDPDDGSIVTLINDSYTFFFDASSRTLYITSPKVAAADEWSEYFLANVGCDANGVNAPTGWTLVGTVYGQLGADVKDYIYGSIASTTGNATQRALATYEWALAHNPNNLTPFITNGDNTLTRGLGLNHYIQTGLVEKFNINSTVLTVVIISAIGAFAIGSYFYYKKKKDNN